MTILMISYQVHFSLSAAPQWTEMVEGYSYHSLYHYIIDYFEQTDTEEAKEEATALLAWWSKYVDPILSIPGYTDHFLVSRKIWPDSHRSNTRGTKMLSRREVLDNM